MELRELMSRIGHEFSDPDLLTKALTHSSYANEGRRDRQSNERLEFLGDSVLGMIAANYLFEHDKGQEGELTKLRASIVCEQALCSYSRELGIGDCLLLGRGERMNGGKDRPSILADAFEAVLAAVYLDGGMEAAKEFVLPFL
ncbi:MAG: ribonuclease III, partial [Clostridia bacterium]|nr:ribonuclease III [Clostridia bacterium]